MGNRAIIVTEKKDLAVYVHHLGDRGYIEAFLAVCKERNFRPPEKDAYGWARLCQVICNYVGDKDGGLGCGVDTHQVLDNGDNKVYIIKDWEIIDTKGVPPIPPYHSKEKILEEIYKREEGKRHGVCR